MFVVLGAGVLDAVWNAVANDIEDRLMAFAAGSVQPDPRHFAADRGDWRYLLANEQLPAVALTGVVVLTRDQHRADRPVKRLVLRDLV